jgi:hypothetical protein
MNASVPAFQTGGSRVTKRNIHLFPLVSRTAVDYFLLGRQVTLNSEDAMGCERRRRLGQASGTLVMEGMCRILTFLLCSTDDANREYSHDQRSE